MTDNILLELLQMMIKAKDAEIKALREIIEKQCEKLNETAFCMKAAAIVINQLKEKQKCQST